MKYCPKCKRNLKLSFFYKNRAQKFGVDVYCKECSKNKGRKYYLYNKEKIKEKYNKDKKKAYNAKYIASNQDKIVKYKKKYAKTIMGKFLSYKNGAYKRGVEFSLSIENFSLFWKKNCFYCNSTISTVGIDRINNNKGYLFENCVSCCKYCNRTKLDLSYKEWNDRMLQYVKFKKGDYTLIEDTSYCLSNKYSKYKYRAKKKGVDFNLGKHQFISMIQNSCHYCGVINYRTATIDRIDNDKGYVIDNCVSCCKYCNSGKRNAKYIDYIRWITQLVEFRSR